MANKLSSAKRYRQSVKRRMRNRITKSTVRTAQRKLNEAIAAGDRDTALAEVARVEKMLDNAAGRGILHRNTVDRTKSRLRRRVNALAG